MMKKRKVRIQVFIGFTLVLLSIFLVGCGDAYEEEVDIKIISYNGDFSGWYIADSGATTTIGTRTYSNPIYSYETSISISDQIIVSASPVQDASGDAESTSLEIIIFQDGEIVDSNIDSSDPVETIRVSYAVGESSE